VRHIVGNRILHDSSETYAGILGPAAVKRFAQDALDQPSVHYVLVLEEMNCNLQGFLEIVIGMVWWTVLNPPHQVIAVLLIKVRRLKTIRAEDDDRTPAVLGLLFGCREQASTIALAPLVGMHPEELHFAHAGPGVASKPRDYLLLLVSYEDCKGPVIKGSGLSDVVLIDLVLNKFEIMRCGLIFDNQVSELHIALAPDAADAT
jgi:hypothetical protein